MAATLSVIFAGTLATHGEKSTASTITPIAIPSIPQLPLIESQEQVTRKMVTIVITGNRSNNSTLHWSFRLLAMPENRRTSFTHAATLSISPQHPLITSKPLTKTVIDFN